MSASRIRRALPSDAEAIAGLLRQLGNSAENAEVLSRMHRLAANERAAVLLADRDGTVVGLATVHILSVLNRSRDVAWLTALVVDASARNTGVGRALVNAVEEFARRADCERLSVTTYEHMTDARDFYVRVGLEQTGRRFGKSLAT